MTQVGAELKVSHTTVIRWLNDIGVKRNPPHEWFKHKMAAASKIELPQFPDEDISAEDLIELQKKRFAIRYASHEAHTWFPVTVKDDKPIGILWFGDPHVDDNGCNWPALERDVKLCRTTDGLYGANIGDTTNNWSGRLIRLYAEQDASVKTARKLAKWFMLDSGVTWLIWLIGNHDAWGDGAEVLAQMAKQHGTQKVICHDWEARFTLSFANGWQPRIHAAHDFPGHSQWNPLHGPMKTGQMGEDADLFVCGHKHNAAQFEWENAARGLFQRFVRVRGYKFMDDYARRLGIPEQTTGCSAVSIFDPEKRQITVLSDVESGADYLTFLRRRGHAQTSSKAVASAVPRQTKKAARAPARLRRRRAGNRRVDDRLRKQGRAG